MITEVEMKEFFQQVVDTVASLSTQASQVEELKQQVHSLNERLDQVEADNATLRQQLSEAAGTITALHNDVRKHSEAEASANEHIVALRDTIVGRDTRVSELEDQVRSEVDAHRITRADLEDARRAVAEWESKYIATNDAYTSTVAQRDEWKQRADEARKEADEYKAKLDRLQSILSPPDLRVVSGQVG